MKNLKKKTVHLNWRVNHFYLLMGCFRTSPIWLFFTLIAGTITLVSNKALSSLRSPSCRCNRIPKPIPSGFYTSTIDHNPLVTCFSKKKRFKMKVLKIIIAPQLTNANNTGTFGSPAASWRALLYLASLHKNDAANKERFYPHNAQMGNNKNISVSYILM